MFTLEQIQEIARKLQGFSKKDSEFPIITDITGEEYIPIVKDGKNCLVQLKVLTAYINPTSILLSPKNMEFNEKGGDKELLVESNQSWTLK